jgi:hypothetical protein
MTGGSRRTTAWELWATVAVFAAAGIAAVVTYTRLPAGATYHFGSTGFVHGGLSRLVSDLSFPVALAGIAWGLLAFTVLDGIWRPVALLAAVLCVVTALPGVNPASDLEAQWINALPAAGALVAGCAALAASTCRVRRRTWPGADRLRLVLVVLLALWAIPWIAAALGLYASDIPVAGWLWNAAAPTPGEPDLPAVHRGLHEGLFGAQLAATALALSRLLAEVRPRGLRSGLSTYLAVMLAYGLMVTAQDGWHEQVVKRGWTSTGLPDVLTPGLTFGWLGLLLGAAAVQLLWFRREYDGR